MPIFVPTGSLSKGDACTFCGVAIPRGKMRCNACGQNQNWTQECINCGRPMPKSAHYCKECSNYQDPKSRCYSCKTHIPPKSRVCTRCNSVQFFRGYVNVSQLTLSLVIGLISVVVALTPLIKKIFTPDRSDTSFSVIEVTKNDRLLVLARNEGNEASYLESVQFEFGDLKKANKRLTIETDADDTDRFILPGKHRVFHLSVEAFDISDAGLTGRGDPLYNDKMLNGGHAIKATILGIREGDKPVSVSADPDKLKEFVKRRATE
jgi:predicted nucleic acid-binding Zn ribbon protein